jgi:hypothetical protein
MKIHTKKIPLLVINIMMLTLACGVTVANAGTQSLTASPGQINLMAGQASEIVIMYDVPEGEKKTTGLGFRVYYDSNVIESLNLENLYGEGLLAVDITAHDDKDNFDNDEKTGKYVGVAWVGVAGDWPSFVKLPLVLGSIKIKTWASYKFISTSINILPSDLPTGYIFNWNKVMINIE